jgi:hypothetical protein
MSACLIHLGRCSQMVFYVSRVLFGFYMNGVLFCMPILFSMEASRKRRATLHSFTHACRSLAMADGDGVGIFPVVRS